MEYGFSFSSSSSSEEASFINLLTNPNINPKPVIWVLFERHYN